MENGRKSYDTVQRKLLMEYLLCHENEELTVEEIRQGLNESGEANIGKSTVYRLINKLVEEGYVCRNVRGNTRQFVYQVVDVPCGTHYHLKCVTCGKLVHLDESATRFLESNILENNDFLASESETMLFGKCKDCKCRNSKKENPEDVL